jgi:putative glutamine amidotransferase
MSDDADRPLVAVTAKVRAAEDKPTLRTIVESGYVKGVEIAGANPLVLSPALEEATASQLLRMCDGLVLTGGEDVDPRRYGASTEAATRVSPERDELEIRAAEWAMEEDVPILAICRGVQLLNVALGGTLWVDLISDGQTETSHDHTGHLISRDIHEVHVGGLRALQGVFRSDTFRTNSTHHQGLRELGEGMVVVGRSEDGVVEAVEYRGDRTDAWVAGVQWHPERMLDERTGTNRRLFERFGQAVRERHARARGTVDISPAPARSLEMTS